jgi:glycosyltransferase involved in cell wall biosynthesis
VEQLERFAEQPDSEIHIYSQKVRDLAGVTRYPAPGHRLVWHKVPRLPGPHLFAYVWWFVANHVQRWWDKAFRGLTFDLLYSPGINALDADAISVHVVFTEFFHRVRPRLRFRDASAWRWPVTLHRRLYYRLICILETRIYPSKRCALTAISGHAAGLLREHFHREDVAVIRYGVDTNTFQVPAREARRASERAALNIQSSEFCLLLIGNDWKSKGLDTLLQALSLCAELPFILLVVGSDTTRAYEEAIRSSQVESKIRFLRPAPDVMQFYAAADAYIGPSLEDAYGLPVLEAMACGLPVIVSARAGASEIVRHRQNGLVLSNPEDSHELEILLRLLYTDPLLRKTLAQEAAKTAAAETWDRNAAATWNFLKARLTQKAGR